MFDKFMFRPGLFAGQAVIVTGGGAGIGYCTCASSSAWMRAWRWLVSHLRVEGTAPNTKCFSSQVGIGRKTAVFKGFHHSTTLRVLQGNS